MITLYIIEKTVKWDPAYPGLQVTFTYCLEPAFLALGPLLSPPSHLVLAPRARPRPPGSPPPQHAQPLQAPGGSRAEGSWGCGGRRRRRRRSATRAERKKAQASGEATPTIMLFDIGLGFLSQFGFLLIGPFQDFFNVLGHWETNKAMKTRGWNGRGE